MFGSHTHVGNTLYMQHTDNHTQQKQHIHTEQSMECIKEMKTGMQYIEHL